MYTSLKLKHIVVFTIFILVTAVSCKKDEPRPIINSNGPECTEDTINLGYIDFTAKTAEWKNYSIDDEIYFVNAENEEISFKKELDISTSFHTFQELSIECIYGDLNEYNLLTERWDQLFVCEEKDLRLRYRLYISLEIPENSFVDRLSAGLETRNTIVQDTSNVIFQALDYNPILEGLMSEFSIIQDYSEFHENIELLGKTFTDVYEKNFSGRGYMEKLYVNKDFGIVGFNDVFNELWVFDRIE